MQLQMMQRYTGKRAGEASERQRRGKESETVIGQCHKTHEQRMGRRVH